MKTTSTLVLCVLSGSGSFLYPARAVAPSNPPGYRINARLADVALTLPPSDVRLKGFLGRRVLNNEKNRLLRVDEDAILAGFRRRPGEQAWIGEHAGKFIHAATLAWANTGDPGLKAKLDRVVRELIRTQEPDGYLGTYPPDRRFGLYDGADWDVWVHKYDLIGLLTYYHYTRSPQALESARKIGDLLAATFGPGKKSILAAGTHMGMAATSVLEPMVLLYRETGDSRYLDFARYIVASWDEPGGPKIMTALNTIKKVEKTGNAKAYEMLSNLVGLCELARATGDRRFLTPALNAWADITANHLYLTGTASSGEHFHAAHELPNAVGAAVGETCVTVTWIQLNAQLLRLTGEARFGDELERSYYNHLAGAQRPDGAEWCYYTALEGTKPYGHAINCCLSSGPRGMALAPQMAYFRYRSSGKDGIAVNLFETSQMTATLGGQRVKLAQKTDFPRSGGALLTLSMGRPATFGVRVRVPRWASSLRVKAMGAPEVLATPGGWAELPARRWKNGDQVKVDFKMGARFVPGAYGNAGRTALMWGPLVMAYDGSKNPRLPPPAALALAGTGKNERLEAERAPGASLGLMTTVRTFRDGTARPALFVPFAEAGATGGRYQVWMKSPGSTPSRNDSLFGFGEESRSRPGNAVGEISDGDPSTFVVTYDNRKEERDWFAVSLDAPQTLRRIVFAHGKTFHDGGWFDTSAGKPIVQVKRDSRSGWETVGVLESYPDTTAASPGGLRDGQSFTLKLPRSLKAVGLRVVGTPSSGDNTNQAFSSCGELQAFSE